MNRVYVRPLSTWPASTRLHLAGLHNSMECNSLAPSHQPRSPSSTHHLKQQHTRLYSSKQECLPTLFPPPQSTFACLHPVVARIPTVIRIEKLTYQFSHLLPVNRGYAITDTKNVSQLVTLLRYLPSSRCFGVIYGLTQPFIIFFLTGIIFPSLHQYTDFQVKEYKLKTAGPRDVDIQVVCCGVCGVSLSLRYPLPSCPAATSLTIILFSLANTILPSPNHTSPTSFPLFTFPLFSSPSQSDVHTITGGWGPLSSEFCVPGHEIVGIVKAVGKDVKEFKVGDRAGEFHFWLLIRNDRGR